MADWQPKIIVFVCNWCSYVGADKAGTLRLQYPARVRLVRVMCSGRVDPQFVLAAFHQGADAVLVLGCHPGDCHYRSGNTKALRRHALLRRTLAGLGVEAARLQLDWVAAGEGERFQKLVVDLSERIAELGPLRPEGRRAREVV